jgi:hypothetical protein
MEVAEGRRAGDLTWLSETAAPDRRRARTPSTLPAGCCPATTRARGRSWRCRSFLYSGRRRHPRVAVLRRGSSRDLVSGSGPRARGRAGREVQKAQRSFGPAVQRGRVSERARAREVRTGRWVRAGRLGQRRVRDLFPPAVDVDGRPCPPPSNLTFFWGPGILVRCVTATAATGTSPRRAVQVQWLTASVAPLDRTRIGFTWSWAAGRTRTRCSTKFRLRIRWRWR